MQIHRRLGLLAAGATLLACGQPSIPTDNVPAAVDGFVYVSTKTAIYTFGIDSQGGPLLEQSNSPVAGGVPEGAGPLAFIPATRMLFGRRYNPPIYRADLRTGALTRLGQVPSQEGMVVDEAGKHVYTIGGSRIGPGGIDFIPYPGKTWAYGVDPATGALSQLSGSPYEGGYYPVDAKLIQAGRFLLACNEGYGGHYTIPESISSISVYARNDATGVLAAVPGSPFPVGCSGENWLAVTPSGRAIYSGGYFPAQISAYRVDADGRPVFTSSVTYGGRFDGFGSMVLDPTGQWLFASLAYSQKALVVFAVDDDARIAQRQRLELDAPAGHMDVDPTGNFLLETRERRLYVWIFDRTLGTLRAAIGSPLQDEGGPALTVYNTLAFGPSGQGYVGTERADGSFRVLPFRLDAAAHSVNPRIATARVLAGEPTSITYVPAER
jgi:6-phosphogluconolactonase (cycloisomerase 2 family)